MHVLIFWQKSKKISIVDEKDLRPSKNEGETTNAIYDKKFYKAKILKKSFDKKYLENIQVTSDGTIIEKNKSAAKSSSTIMAQENLKLLSKMNKNKKQEELQSRNKKLLDCPSIFEESDDENFNLEVKSQQKRTELPNETGFSSSEEGDVWEQEARHEEMRERLRDQEHARERLRDEERARERLRDQERERERMRDQERARERLRDQERERERMRDQEREKERQRKCEAERHREKDRELERQRDREREGRQHDQEKRERERGLRKSRSRSIADDLGEGLEREREKERERAADRQREREAGRRREQDRERERHRQQEREERRERRERRSRSRSIADDLGEDLEHEREKERERAANRQREYEADRQREREAGRRREQDRERERQRQQEREERRERRERRSRSRSIGDDSDVDEDPLVLCRQGGNGKVMLCDVWNVWIDKALLTYYQRFKKNPKEMTRRLLKTLVGRRNLKNMCARGRTRNRDGIPRDIMNAIEFYVNETCSQDLTPGEFTNVANMMICSLRNPRR